MLSASNPTTRAFGYRNTLHFKQFQSEQILLTSDCTVTSNELGAGRWCAAGGSNAGFEVSFIREPFDETHSYNTAEFFGQEAFCNSLKTDCFCSDQTTDQLRAQTQLPQSKNKLIFFSVDSPHSTTIPAIVIAPAPDKQRLCRYQAYWLSLQHHVPFHVVPSPHHD